MPRIGDPDYRWAHLADSQSIDPRDLKGEPIHYRGNWSIRIIAGLVAKEIGWTSPMMRPDWTPLLRWLDDGLDPHAVILPTIRRVVARLADRSIVGSLAYFDQAVRTAPQRRTG